MRKDVDRDFKYSDQFSEAIGHVCQSFLKVVRAPMEIDWKQATDWMVVNVLGKAIAARVRKPGFLDLHHWEFTVRSRRVSKVKTELAKITEDGFGDAMIYAHDDGSGKEFKAWRAISLHEFRKHPSLWYKAREIPNTDKTSFFRAYDVRDFPPELVIGSFNHRPLLVLGEYRPSNALYDHTKTFNDQSIEYYIARGHEDIANLRGNA